MKLTKKYRMVSKGTNILFLGVFDNTAIYTKQECWETDNVTEAKDELKAWIIEHNLQDNFDLRKSFENLVIDLKNYYNGEV
jgi:hypothetical protein